MKITFDALLLFLSGILLILYYIFSNGYNHNLIIILIGFILASYRVNCMIIGNCYIYARIISLSSLIFVMLVISFNE
jgi:hypothetical protein